MLSLGRPTPTDITYSWVRPAVLAADNGREGMFLFLLFLHSFIFLSPLSLSFISSTVSSISFSFSLGDDTKWLTRVDVSLNSQHNKSQVPTAVSLLLNLVGVASCLHSIPLMNGWVLAKLTQIYYWMGEKCWLDFVDLDPIFKVTWGLRLLEKARKLLVCTLSPEGTNGFWPYLRI